MAMRLRQVWYPTLQRYRMDIVTQIATRIGANLSSIEHGLEVMGDIEDVEKELERIYDNKKKIGEFEQSQFGGGGFKNNSVKDPTALAEPAKITPTSTKGE